MRLKGQFDQSSGPTISPIGLIEFGGLKWSRSRITVICPMHDEEWCLQPQKPGSPSFA